MPRKPVPTGTQKKFGPYAGSAANQGRPIYVYKEKQADGTWKTTSKNKARADYEEKNGPLPKKTHVDHKDNNKKNDAKGNLRAVSAKENIAKGNKNRPGVKKKGK